MNYSLSKSFFNIKPQGILKVENKAEELTEKNACTKGDDTDECSRCRAKPFAFKPTNSPVADRVLATICKCSGSMFLPVSAIADSKFCIYNSVLAVKYNFTIYEQKTKNKGENHSEEKRTVRKNCNPASIP